MANLTLSVPDISCNHCKMSIEGAVNDLDGVKSAAVDVAKKSVSVSFDEGALTRDTIVEAIEEQGYEVAAV